MGAPDKLIIPKKSDGMAGHPSIVMDPRAHDRDTLRLIITQWNANRLDLFELSQPDENMEFYGVMRFYFQEEGSKIATKCVRVSSGQMASQVVAVLVEKFRPDMRMLTLPRYGLYEVHANGEERRLREEEKPLLVQLNWHKDDREGRFLLKNEDEPRKNRHKEEKKKVSKQEKKEQKRKEKEEKLKNANESLGITAEPNDAENLFKQLPETSFHRSISNPEAVMRRRRQQKLEKKLQQFKSKDGGPDSGGTLKIFGETINRDVPYKTLLLSVHDNVESVIKQTLEKYGLERDDYANYCLVQAVLPPGSPNDVNVDPSLIKETVLASTDCPLQILMHFPAAQGILVFNLKKRPIIGQETVGNDASPDNGISRPLLVQNPYLIESLPNGVGQAVQLFPGTTEIGNDHLRLGSANFFHLVSPDIFPSHCFFHRLEASVVVSLAKDRPAMVSVDGRVVEGSTVLQNGALIRIGQNHAFRFCVPSGFSTRPPQNGGAGGVPREKLQLPLVDVAQPKKLSPDLPPGNFKNVPNGNSQLINKALHHLDCLDADLPDTNSSVTYSHRSSPEMHAIMNRAPGQGTSSKLPILPATLEFREDREDAFLFGVIISPNPVGVNFKLSPTYVLYMAARYRGSTNFRPEVVPTERAHLLSKFLRKIATIFHRVVDDNQGNAEYLCFWLANSSELLHLLKLDRHMSIYGTDAHEILAECVHLAFHHLVRCQQELLHSALPGLFAGDDSEEESESGGWGSVLEVLTRTLHLARRCRLNAALTIQIFAHLFHYISVWLFNSIVHHPDRCNRHFGTWLRGGLDHLLEWADKHGLETGAEYHLAKIIQVTNLLNMPKEDTSPSIYASACYRLNSLQVRFIMEMYERSPEDRPFTAELVDAVTGIAVSMVDEPDRQNGQLVQLEEPLQLQLGVVIPDEGYSVGIINGVPPGLREFLDPLSRTGACEMVIHPYSQGSWTVYLVPSSGERSPSVSFESGRQQQLLHPTQHLPVVIEVSFPKGSSGIGLSIIAYPTPGQGGKLGVYVKAVVKGGAADQDGRLESGDQLLKVNGKSLIGVTQEHAAKLIAQTGQQVHMEVLKHGAVANGLATMLTTPSPPPPFVKSQINGNATMHHYPRPADFSGRDQLDNGFPTHYTGSLLHNGELVRPGNRQPKQPVHHYPQEATTPTRVVSLPPPSQDYRGAQTSPNARHTQHENFLRIQPSGAVNQRTPSPQEQIASQMLSQRDKFRKDAKLFEIEDELRRRREQLHNGHQSPVNGIRAGPAMNGRGMAPSLNSHRTMSTERLDVRPVNGHGKPPVEKRVQWAVDSPKKSESPTSSHHSSPTGPVRTESAANNQSARIVIPPTIHTARQSPITISSRPPPAQEPATWSRDLRDQSASPSTISRLQQDDPQQLRLWKQSEMRRFRDEEIASLESRQDQLAPNEAERLRILRLERDFQRRVGEHRQEELDEEEDDEDQQDEVDNEIRVTQPTKLPVGKPTPHLHHPAAASGSGIYKTSQQEDYDAFVRRHEAHAANEVMRRSREHLEERVPTVRFQEPQVQQQTYSLPEVSRHSTSPPRKPTHDHRLSTGAEIRREVEAAKTPSAASVAVIGAYEVYNDPRNRILNAKVKPPIVGTDISPEKLSFRDKMKMFAMTQAETAGGEDSTAAARRPRDADFTTDY